MPRKKHRKAILSQKREKREESFKHQRRKKYSEMSAKGLLGERELHRYEQMRVEVIRSSRKNGENIYFPCEARGEIPTRDSYRELALLYDRIIED